MSKNYMVNEGDRIGYLPTEFSATTVGALVDKKIVAGADVTKGQLVMLSDSLTVVPATAASKFVLGVAMFDALSGQPVAVECEGLFSLTAGAVITAPAILSAGADGKVIAQATTEPKIGIAISDATLNGEVLVKFSV